MSIDIDTFAAWVSRPDATPAPTAGPQDPPVVTGPWWPRTDSDFPHATDPALDGHTPPTLDDLGLTADPVAIILAAIDQLTPADLARVKARLTDDDRAALVRYEQQPARHLKAVS